MIAGRNGTDGTNGTNGSISPIGPIGPIAKKRPPRISPRRSRKLTTGNETYGQTPTGIVNDWFTVTVVPLTVAEAPWPTP